MSALEQIDEQAADWLLQLSEAPDTPQLRADFEAWKDLDPRHAEAANRMQAFIGQVQALRPQRAPVQHALQAGFKPRRRPGKQITQGLLVLLLAGIPLLALLRSYPPSYLLADLRTAPAQWREEQLADHSRLVLAGNSAVDLHFDERERRVQLLRGEILVDVAKDKARPFIVTTEHGSMRALGTRFLVRHDADATTLTMLESRVDARSADAASGLEVSAGQQARITPLQVSLADKVDSAAVGNAWSRHQLVVQNRPLSEVLELLASQRHGQVRFDSMELADLRVSAILPLDDTDRALQLIADALPVRVRQFTPLLVIVDRKP